MLRQLSLRDFVLVSQLNLDFEAGFTVLTGETGAGKSILIDALQLALGGRGDVTVVREGQERAEISASFEASKNPMLRAWLHDAGFECEEGELLLRRIIDNQGKSRAWINGSPATITQLRELGEFLIDIHGQHAWQGLTKPDRVRDLLDAYGRIDTTALLPLWGQWQSAKSKLQRAQLRLDAAQEEKERLEWQIAEVEKLGPEKDEWKEISSEHDRLSHGQMLIDSTQTASGLLSSDQNSAIDQIHRAITTLDRAAAIDSSLAEVLNVLKDAHALVDDASHSLSGWLRHADLDPNRLDALDTRMGSWVSLARRYRRKPEELYAQFQEWKQELAELEEGSDIEALEQATALAEQEWRVVAKEISLQRQQAAPKLSQAISAAMQTLGMKDGLFKAQITPLEGPQSYGLETIEFLVAGHAGATPRPVSKVASGGELSRLALAIAVTTSQLGHTPTLIFDEIDSGIGGSVAQTVGQLMQRLGADKQVLSVTHLAQVASYGHQHLVVHKQSSTQDNQSMTTTSSVNQVEYQERIAEIARMLGGGEQSQAGLAHAQEMLHSAQHSAQK